MPMRVRRIIREEIEIPGLGDAIKSARLADPRSVTELARLVNISRNYWYQLETESSPGGVAEGTLRKIERILKVDFGVKFEH